MTREGKAHEQPDISHAMRSLINGSLMGFQKLEELIKICQKMFNLTINQVDEMIMYFYFKFIFQ